MQLTIAESAAPVRVVRYRWTPRVVAQLSVLAVAAYVYAIAEMAPIGAMPAIASDLHVSEASVGMLTAAYAFISVVTTVPLVRCTASWPRRRVLVLTLACLTVSQALSAIAPGLAMLAMSRVLCAITHGLMWSIIVPIGARLVPSTHTGRAATAVYTGTSAALIIGNPLTSSMSQSWGWRPTVAVIAVIAGVITLLAQVILPTMAVGVSQARTVANPARKPLLYRNGPLAVVCVLTLIGVTAHFASYTYIVPIIRDVVHIGGSADAWVLGAYGVAGLVTMAVLARAADHRLRSTVAGGLGVLCLAFWTLTALAVLGAGAMVTVLGVIAIVVWGASAAALPPMLQSAAIRTSPEEAEHASALYITAFQVGILAGSIAGGLVYEQYSIATVVAISAMLFAVALLGVILRGDAFQSSPPLVSQEVSVKATSG